MKRGSSGLSLVVAVNKPSGMTSHDVVNRCRRIFGERRVGHTGTLDPLANGVLPICVGPATRLDKYLTGHDKRYRVTMTLGFETTTDDVMGEPTEYGTLTQDLLNGSFADAYVKGLVGVREQIPPQYSAIKVQGKKAYEVARQGGQVNLQPRRIEVFESSLIERGTSGDSMFWVVDFSVSKGTYIRSLVRDMGRELGCRAHVSTLQRLEAGSLRLDDCMSLETIESLGVAAAIDPVRLLGYRFAFADDISQKVDSGGKLSARDVPLFEFDPLADSPYTCACTGTLMRASGAPNPDELVAIVVQNKLKAIYRFDAQRNAYVPDCVFSTPITRHEVAFGGNVGNSSYDSSTNTVE